MKIEKISDTQLKIILTRDDFKERDLHLSELTYYSEKAQKLLRDIMEKASFETGFVLDQSPLIIEAVPISNDSIMVIVSKSTGGKEEYISSISSMFNKLSDSGEPVCYEDNKNNQFCQQQNKKIKVPKNMAIYSFDSMDDVSLVSERLSDTFRGASSLHKYNGKYYICLQMPYKSAIIRMGNLETILDEYGQKHVSNSISRGFLLEHGEMLINSNAVNKLANL